MLKTALISITVFPRIVSAETILFLNLTLCNVLSSLVTVHMYRCGNYSREETIQGRKLYEEIGTQNTQNAHKVLVTKKDSI